MAILLTSLLAISFLCGLVLIFLLQKRSRVNSQSIEPERTKIGARREKRPVPAVVTEKGDNNVTPISVNYHFTRQCNYKCGFCFHTAKTSFLLPLEEVKRGLKLLKDAGNSLSISLSLSLYLFLSLL